VTLLGEEVANMAPVPLPPGYHSVNPYIVVAGAARLIDFLYEVFGGLEQGRARRDDGAIEHADVLIGDSLVMISEASPEYPARPCVHFVYVDDVDRTHRRAVELGARSILAPTDQRWGDRVGGVVDPFDNRWWIATHQQEFS
jgi:PhnB protein